ncbi:TrkH family potassium uptake protein [Pisciglobus halotolerans]|uniref:Trk system potassium uptake protein TrkH n=1 Tax=Pisciglobus halotolerans TaxID=745365 RepID=A0A1I3B1W7_9LACT|nr:potassium transporter TrkG [Pisciglobus halotolerans]SFH56192.1 trk system potassium uptake protein TrkH [Pisciglobus halotolerans]
MGIIIGKIKKLSPAAKIALSFLIMILIGSFLLALPISQTSFSEATYFDHLFMATSMVCVTGLFSVPIASTYSFFGQVISLGLIQIGGLGLMTLLAALVMGIGKKMSYANTIAVQEALNREKMGDFKPYLISIVLYTALFEGIGTLLLLTHFVPEFGWDRGFFMSLFLAVSAFCNAGFDLFGAGSLQEYVHQPVVNLVVGSLIVLGGIGFPVWFDLSNNFRSLFKRKRRIRTKSFFRRLQVHSRLALTMSFILVVTGIILFLLVEWNNSVTIGDFTFGEKLLTAFFETVTMRSGGFTTIDLANMRPFTLLYFILNMFIGGSPGGTAGGVKTTTLALLVLLIYNDVRGQKNINYHYHTIAIATVRKAIVVIGAFFVFLVLGAGLLFLFEPDKEPLRLLFETVAAFSTGASINLTTELSWMSQVVLMVIMFVGRIGPITIFLSLERKNREVTDVKYATTNILIG